MQKAALVLALSAPATAFMPASVKRSAVAAKGTADPWFPDTILDFDPAVSAKTGPVKKGPARTVPAAKIVPAATRLLLLLPCSKTTRLP